MKNYVIPWLIFQCTFGAEAATRVWDGGAPGADANWATAANWTGNVIPGAGDFLGFPAGLSKKTLTNNLAANTDFSGFSFTEDYALRGNAVDLTNLVSVASNGVVIDLSIRLLANVHFAVSNKADLLINGPLQLNAHTATFDNDGGPAVVAGVISGTGINSRVTKDGFGSLELQGANSYTGLTAVVLGTLIVNGSVASDLDVQSLATLTGSGSVGSTTNTGKLRPGDGGPGIFTVNGLFRASTSAAMFVDIAGTTVGTGYDQLVVSGAVELGSADLSIVRDPAFIPALNTVFTIINKTGAGAITGTFSGLPQGAMTNVSGVTYQISYVGGNGNDVTLTVVDLDPPLVTRVWDGGSALNNNWSTSTNWAGDVTPEATNHLQFPRTALDAICTNNFAVDTVFSSLRFTGTAATNNYPLLRGNSIRLLSGIVATNLGSSGAVALELPIKLAASQTFTNSSTNTDIELRSNLTVHPFTLTVRGPGTFRTTGNVTATNNANLVVINGGHLAVNGSLAGNVSATAGGELSGVGTVGAVTVSSANLSPGDSGTGTLTVNGTLTLNAASTLNLELTNSTPGSGHDQVIVSNANVTLGSAALNLTVSATATDVVGTTFTILKLTNPTNTISGTFAGLAEGAEVDAAPLRFRISYAGGNGHDVVLTITGAVPSNQEVGAFLGADQGDAIRVTAAQTFISGVTNDHAPGSSFDRVTLTDAPGVGGIGGVVVRGNLMRLERGIAATNHVSQSDVCKVTLELPLALNADQTFQHNLNWELAFGNIDLDGHALTLDVHKFVTVGIDGIRVTGVISGTGAASQLIKIGPDPLTLASASGTNTYEGTTTVLEGELVSSGTLFSTIVLITNGTLNSSGIVGGIISTGGVISLGTLQSTGAVSLDPGLQLQARVSSSAVSRLTCDSSVSLGGASLRLNVSPTPPGDTNFVILSKTSAGPVIGTFAGLPQNADFITNGHHYRITYTGGDGNDVAIVTTNNPPVLTPVANQTITEQTLFSLPIAASDADPADRLTYSLDPGSPTNATINATNGLLSWTPTETQGPGIFNMNIRATDNGNPVKSATASFQVSVLDSNLPPILTAPATVTSNELTQITFAISGSDPDNPPDTLTYQLVQGPPGMVLNSTSSASALLTWVPTEAQGPSTNIVLVSVSETGSGLSTTQSVAVIAREVNVAPVFHAIAGTNVLPGQLIERALIATDSDLPSNPLTFQLISPPAGATIVSNSIFQWTPSASQVGLKTITIRCSDTNADALTQKSLNVSQQFNVYVGILRIVSNTNDSGTNSLRQAILDVNTNTGGGFIQFNIPGPGPQRIAPLSPLPVLATATTIDGYTQPGARPNQITNGTDAVIRIEISGENVPGSTALTWGVNGDQPTTIRGLCINRFTNGAALTCGCSSCGGRPTSGMAIEGCFIGTDPTGTLALPNGSGITFLQTHDSRIGGPDLSQRNLISGNLFNGINLAEGFDGAFVFNLIIQNNLVGTDSTGTNALGNRSSGIEISTGGVGGFGAHERFCLIADNVFAANGQSGFSFGGNNNRYVRNKIGIGADGTTPLGNHSDGVSLFGDSDQLGGTNAADANIIANNNGAGVRVTSGVGHAVLGNSIFNNSTLGIDLGGTGLTPNDPGDSDTGANDLQNFPLLTSVVPSPAGVTVSGSLNSLPNASYRIELFHSTNTPVQATRFVGATDVTTDAGGNANFSVNLTNLLVPGFFTATATDTNGSTSEISSPVALARLEIQILGSSVRVLWANSLTGFVLESNSDLANPGGWAVVPGAPSNDGQNFFRDFAPGNVPLFFRLHLP